MTLVDTSVWIDWFRQGQRPATLLLDDWVDTGDLVLAPVVLQELQMGARSFEQLASLQAHFRAIVVLPPTLRTYGLAGELYARCRWAGITPRSPHDCLIAATAVEYDVPLLHDDRDFEQLARVEPGLRLVAV